LYCFSYCERICQLLWQQWVDDVGDERGTRVEMLTSV
jgi:hypothetical protein